MGNWASIIDFDHFVGFLTIAPNGMHNYTNLYREEGSLLAASIDEDNFMVPGLRHNQVPVGTHAFTNVCKFITAMELVISLLDKGAELDMRVIPFRHLLTTIVESYEKGTMRIIDNTLDKKNYARKFQKAFEVLYEDQNKSLAHEDCRRFIETLKHFLEVFHIVLPPYILDSAQGHIKEAYDCRTSRAAEKAAFLKPSAIYLFSTIINLLDSVMFPKMRIIQVESRLCDGRLTCKKMFINKQQSTTSTSNPILESLLDNPYIMHRCIYVRMPLLLYSKDIIHKKKKPISLCRSSLVLSRKNWVRAIIAFL